MALTEYTDASSDDGVEVHSTLNAAKLEEHNKSMGVETEETPSTGCSKSETYATRVPSQVGAGLLFGLSGLFLGGPFFGLLAGGGATYAATNNDGPVGDAARASGDFAVETGSKVGEAAVEANEKYGVVLKIKDALASGCTKVRQYDEEHNVTEKLKESVWNGGQKAADFERKNHFAETILGGIQKGVNFLLEKLRDATATSSEEKSKSKNA